LSNFFKYGSQLSELLAFNADMTDSIRSHCSLFIIF